MFESSCSVCEELILIHRGKIKSRSQIFNNHVLATARNILFSICHLSKSVFTHFNSSCGNDEANKQVTNEAHTTDDGYLLIEL